MHLSVKQLSTYIEYFLVLNSGWKYQKRELRIQKWKTKKEKKEDEKTSLGRNDKSLKGPTLLDNSRRTKREKLSTMEKKEKRHVKRKSKVKGPSYEIINEDTEDVKLPEKKRQKKEKRHHLK